MDVAKRIGEANAEAPPFYRAVYEVVHSIPRGKVATYGDVARAAGSPGAARAVGTAMRWNQDTSRVPCHRVIRSDGHVGDYGGGPQNRARKIELLLSEGVDVDLETGRIRDLKRFLHEP